MCIRDSVCCGAYFLLGWFFPYSFLGCDLLWRAHPFENHFYNWKSILFWWSNCEAFDSKSILFWLVHGEVWHINSISTSGNISFLFCKWINHTAVGPIFYWGGFSITVSWGANSSEGHPPLKIIFAFEIDAFLMKQLRSFWFQVNSVLVGPWWSLAHQ